MRVVGWAAIVAVACLLPRPALCFSRFNAAMDNGTTITVDNDSSQTNSWVGGLVLAADRSTQDDCPYAHSRKGLMKTGDRVYVNDNYMAWFDYTQADGITFANPPVLKLGRQVGIADGMVESRSSTGYFRYWKTGPNGCWNWAHNELIPGSASPNQEQHWWDKYYTPNEHVICPIVGSNQYFFPLADAWRTSRTQFAQAVDGVKDAAGVHYKTTCKVCSWHGNIDCTDDNDANGIANYINTELEYVCRPDDVDVIWNFKPANANVVVYNLFAFLWTSYAQDEDGSACDVSSLGSQWPGTVYGQDLYNQSNMALITGWSGSQYVAGTYVPMVLGPTCSDPYHNQDIYTTPRYAVTNGSWIRCGEASNLSINSPRWLFTVRGMPNSGSGSASDPIRFPWDKLESWNETHDGTLGFGGLTGVYSNPSDYVTLLAGTWYRVEYTVRTNGDADWVAPGPVMIFRATRGDQQVTLTWRNPSIADFTGTMIRYKTTGYPTSVNDGTLVVDQAGAPGSDASFVHTGLTNSRIYYYSAFAHDTTPNFSTKSNVLMVPGDETAPGPVSGFAVTVGDGRNSLSWTNPTDADFEGVKILAKTTGYPSSTIDGTVVYDGTGTSCVHSDLANGTPYYYAAYAYDETPNYSTRATASGTPVRFCPLNAKQCANGTELTLTVGVVSAVGSGWFYAQCPDTDCGPCGIKVVMPGHGVLLGQSVWVKGTAETDTSTGEKYILATWASGSGSGGMSPMGMSNLMLGGGDWFYNSTNGAGQKGVEGGIGTNNIGLLVRVWGRVTQRKTSVPQYFYIDDGSRACDGTQTLGVNDVGIRVSADPTGHNTGDYVVVTGVSSCFTDESGKLRRLVVPREIRTLP